jgi:hypothetical protein
LAKFALAKANFVLIVTYTDGKEATEKYRDMWFFSYLCNGINFAEYKRYFETEHSVAEIKPSANEHSKLLLMIDELGNVNWFRQKYREFQERIGINLQKAVNKKQKS